MMPPRHWRTTFARSKIWMTNSRSSRSSASRSRRRRASCFPRCSPCSSAWATRTTSAYFIGSATGSSTSIPTKRSTGRRSQRAWSNPLGERLLEDTRSRRGYGRPRRSGRDAPVPARRRLDQRERARADREHARKELDGRPLRPSAAKGAADHLRSAGRSRKAGAV